MFIHTPAEHHIRPHFEIKPNQKPFTVATNKAICIPAKHTQLNRTPPATLQVHTKNTRIYMVGQTTYLHGDNSEISL